MQLDVAFRQGKSLRNSPGHCVNKRDVRAGIKGIAVTQCTSERFIETRSIIRRLASEKR